MPYVFVGACRKCDRSDPPCGFYILPSGKPRSQCRDCESITARCWREKNLTHAKTVANAYKEKYKKALAEKVRIQRVADPEKFRERYRRWQKKHPEYKRSESSRALANVRAKAWANANAGKVRRLKNARRAANREAQRAQARAYYAAHKDVVLGYKRKWRVKNPTAKAEEHNRRRAVRIRAAGRCSSEQLVARIAYYGGCCAYCGGVYNTIDHVVALACGGTNWPANLRPACKRCNSSKGVRPLRAFLDDMTRRPAWSKQ